VSPVPQPKTLRVFAALDVSAEVRGRLDQTLRPLSALIPREAVRWVRAEGMHLTLKFYGEVDVEQLPVLRQVLQEAAKTSGPLTLKVEGLGAFPNWQRTRVIWAGLQGALTELQVLQTEIETRSRLAGFAIEERAFKPHLTLGRVKVAVDLKSLGRTLDTGAIQTFGVFTATTLNLIQSELRVGGARYTQLAAFPLQNLKA